MISETIFVMIKPDVLRLGLLGNIISRFENAKFIIKHMKTIKPPKDVDVDFYQEHRPDRLKDLIIQFKNEHNMVVMIIEGSLESAIAITRTIRDDLACNTVNNLVYCSDSLDSANRYIEIWFKYLELV